MKKFWITVSLLSLYNFSCFCQQENKGMKNFVSLSYVSGSNDPGAFEISYERMVNPFKIKTGIGVSILPAYQYDPFSSISVFSIHKKYYKQNLAVFEATPYLFTSRKKEENKGPYLRGGMNAIPFHLKYDRKINDTSNEKIDKYIMVFGLTGGIGYQFSLFKNKRGRIEFGGRTSLFRDEPEIIMFKMSAGINF
jgi:hypothetical protein